MKSLWRGIRSLEEAKQFVEKGYVDPVEDRLVFHPGTTVKSPKGSSWVLSDRMLNLGGYYVMFNADLPPDSEIGYALYPSDHPTKDFQLEAVNEVVITKPVKIKKVYITNGWYSPISKEIERIAREKRIWGDYIKIDPRKQKRTHEIIESPSITNKIDVDLFKKCIDKISSYIEEKPQTVNLETRLCAWKNNQYKLFLSSKNNALYLGVDVDYSGVNLIDEEEPGHPWNQNLTIKINNPENPGSEVESLLDALIKSRERDLESKSNFDFIVDEIDSLTPYKWDDKGPKILKLINHQKLTPKQREDLIKLLDKKIKNLKENEEKDHQKHNNLLEKISSYARIYLRIKN